jgi:hypothetical protein
VKFKLLLFVKKKVPELQEIPIAPDLVDYDEWKNRVLMARKAIETGIRYKNRSFRCAGCEFGYMCNRSCEEQIEYRKAA